MKPTPTSFATPAALRAWMAANHAAGIVLLALASGACGRVGLDRGPAYEADAAVVADAARDGLAIDRASVPDAADEAPVGPPAATIIRIVNVGATDFKLYRDPSYACPYGFLIQGAAPVEEITAIEPPEWFCNCDSCPVGTNGRPRCETTDLICDDPPFVIAPGAHFDYWWDRTVFARVAPPADSGCLGLCTAFLPVPVGTYAFTLQQPAGDYTVQAALPAAGGIIEIPVSAR